MDHLAKKGRVMSGTDREEEQDNSDRISHLPEPLLHHILSFLSKDSQQILDVRTFSKTWLRVWNTLPVLRFIEVSNSTFYNYPGEAAKRRRKQMFDLALKTFLARVSHKVSIREFKVSLIFLDPELAPQIDECVRYAIQCNVETIVLAFVYGLYESGRYIVPGFLLGATSLAKLVLYGCRLEISTLRNTVINLSFLKYLRLSEVYADDESIRNLVAGCHQIVYMEFLHCKGIKTLSVCDLVKLISLKVMYLYDLKQLDIGSSNLRCLYLSTINISHEINLACCCEKLITLELCDTTVTDEWLLTQTSQLLFLQRLTLSGCGKLKNAKVLNHSLKELCIFSNPNLTRVEISTPNLRKLCYSGGVIPFSSNKTLALSELTLKLVYNSKGVVITNTDWFRYLIHLLVQFNNPSTVFNLKYSSDQHCVVTNEIREALSPPSYNFKKLNLSSATIGARLEISEIVDAALWISPHQKHLSISFDSATEFHFQFTYGKDLSPCCCKSSPVSCWQSCIKNVKIVSIVGGEKKKCSLADNIWEKMKNSLSRDLPTKKST